VEFPRPHIDARMGYKGEETPYALTLDGVRLTVLEIVKRWYTETHCCFRVQASDGQRYVLRYDLDQERWELVMKERVQEK